MIKIKFDRIFSWTEKSFENICSVTLTSKSIVKTDGQQKSFFDIIKVE
jgi:hypothetical protein